METVSPEAEKQFLEGRLPAFQQQEVRLCEGLISEDLLSSHITIFDVTEKEGYHPTRIVVAFQSGSCT